MAKIKTPDDVAEQWDRYRQMRRTGHSEFLNNARKCRDYFLGKQWSDADKAKLDRAKRPALTINKILSTVSTILGEQISGRTEISFLPTVQGTESTASALNHVFKNISNRNGLDWVRSEVFANGIITGRGFFDARLQMNDSLTGDVLIRSLLPEYVIIDPDAETDDPKEWSDLIITRWMSPNMVGDEYYASQDIDYIVNQLRTMSPEDMAFMDDAVGRATWGSGGEGGATFNDSCIADKKNNRSFRVLERQYRERARKEHFVDPLTGDKTIVPSGWSRDQIAAYAEQNDVRVMPFMASVVKSKVTVDRFVLHDGQEPVEHFSVIPFFPYFQPGKPLGLVENLLSPQELLNKASSQELHVINTTANSGWKVKSGALTNMTIADLEERGAETGLVVEVQDMDGIDKITPNPYPTGLDRITFKAENSIKEISNVTDSMLGQDRADVAAKAIEAKQQRGQVTLIKPMDNLARSDSLLATITLAYVQRYYREPRIISTMRDEMTKEMEFTEVNTPRYNDDSGAVEIVNDLSVGVYDVTVAQTPARAVLEDIQFEQAARLRELGVPIPDDVLIKNSRLEDRADIVRRMEEQAAQPDPLRDAEVRQAQAQAASTEATAANTQAQAQLNMAKVEELMQNMQNQIADLQSKIAERDNIASNRDNQTALNALEVAQSRSDADNAEQQAGAEAEAQSAAEAQAQHDADIATLMGTSAEPARTTEPTSQEKN